MSDATAQHPRSARREWPRRLVFAALLAVGAVVMAWPVGTTVVHDSQVAQQSLRYARAEAALGAQPLAAARQRAQAYNAALAPGSLNDPWSPTASTPAATQAHHDYLTQLDAAGAMGRLRIPRVAVDLPINHDTDGPSLERGVGHLYGSSLPVGGAGSHAVLAGHSNWPGATFLDRLPELRQGDRFFLDVAGETLTYAVDQISVVQPDRLSAIQRVPGQDYVTLVTCEIRDNHPVARILVRGVRVSSPAADAAVTTSVSTTTTSVPVVLHGTQWMWPRLAGAGAVLLLLVVMAARWARGDRRRRQGVPR